MRSLTPFQIVDGTVWPLRLLPKGDRDESVDEYVYTSELFSPEIIQWEQYCRWARRQAEAVA